MLQAQQHMDLLKYGVNYVSTSHASSGKRGKNLKCYISAHLDVDRDEQAGRELHDQMSYSFVQVCKMIWLPIEFDDRPTWILRIKLITQNLGPRWSSDIYFLMKFIEMKITL